MNLIFAFVAGMFLTNSIPHLVAGIKGKSHMTPLAKNSSYAINIIWAFVNIIIGAWFLGGSGGNLAEILSLNTFSMAFIAGSIFMALADGWLFSNPNAGFPWFKK